MKNSMSTPEVDTRKQTHERQERKLKNYLHPNHVRKSKTEFAVSLLNRLAQLHKLEIKLILIFWAEVTLFLKASLFLAHQIVQNRHKGAAVQIFSASFPRLHLARLKGYEGPSEGIPN